MATARPGQGAGPQSRRRGRWARLRRRHASRRTCCQGRPITICPRTAGAGRCGQGGISTRWSPASTCSGHPTSEVISQVFSPSRSSRSATWRLGCRRSVRASLERVLAEQRQQDRLMEYDSSQSVPPALCRSAWYREDHVRLRPCRRVALPAVPVGGMITKFMGETSAKLRLIFDAAED